MTTIYSFSATEKTQFTSPHPSSAFEPDVNMFIVGNVLPPLAALVSVYDRRSVTVELPEYGSLISFTAYDGILYCLIGLDEDIPWVGHVVSVDLNTFKSTQLFKFKIPTTQKFKVGGPFLYNPATQDFYFMLTGSLTLLSASGVSSTPVIGGYTHLWNASPNSAGDKLIGYGNGLFRWITPQTNTTSDLKQFNCKTGLPSVDSVAQMIYHLEMCNPTSPEMKTVTFTNTSELKVPVDPALAKSVSMQSGGLYTPFGCGANCNVHTDCDKSVSCGTCRLGVCVSSGECGAFCTGPQDCFGGVCVGDCEENRCGRAGCGKSCQNHDECSASRTCKVCRLGSCVDDGECGSYCLTPLDCYGGACVGNCVDFTCTMK